jgi:hypothetical protein
MQIPEDNVEKVSEVGVHCTSKLETVGLLLQVYRNSTAQLMTARK